MEVEQSVLPKHDSGVPICKSPEHTPQATWRPENPIISVLQQKEQYGYMYSPVTWKNQKLGSSLSLPHNLWSASVHTSVHNTDMLLRRIFLVKVKTAPVLPMHWLCTSQADKRRRQRMKHTTFRMILRREKKPSENSCPPQSSGGNRDNSLGFSNACFVVWLLLPEGRAEAWTLALTKPELWLQCCSPSVVYSGPFPVGPDPPCPFCSKGNRRDATSARVY